MTTEQAPPGPGVATPGPGGVPLQYGGTPRKGPRPTATTAARRAVGGVQLIGLGSAVVYLSLIVLIPLAMVVAKSTGGGAVAVAVINLVVGTVIAWVLVRDRFPGKSVIDLLIDLPFALPTVVAGLVLLALYGTQSPLRINVAFTRTAVVLALLFVTLPYVVRTVQPVLLELDRDMEEAAHSLGASRWTTFRRIVLPNLAPAMLSGAGLAFARAIAEFGSTSLVSGNLPGQTQVASVVVYTRIQNDDPVGAAALSTVLLVLAFVVLIVLDLIQRRAARRGQ